MIWQMKIFAQYMGPGIKKSYSESFLEHKEIRLHTKFQTYLTLHSVFLPINPIFKKEIFGLKIFPLLQFFAFKFMF